MFPMSVDSKANFLRHHPVGAPIPHSLHAVCSSLPSLADVIRYEQKDPEAMQVMQSGYPRFVLHHLIRELTDRLKADYGLGDRAVYIPASLESAEALVEYIGAPDASIIDVGGFYLVHFAPIPHLCDRAKAFLQHTGSGISSRQAQAILVGMGILDESEKEASQNGDATAIVYEHLHPWIQSPWLKITNSGMNAVYAAFRALQSYGRKRNRHIYLQLGWLYLDTQRVLERFRGSGEKHITLPNVFDMDAVEAIFQAHGGDIAGVITEVPNNPQVETFDLSRLNTLCRRYEVVRIFDPSIVGCVNVDLLPHTDILTLSLTKYAANHGTVMAGALALNPQSPFFGDLAEELEGTYIPPFHADLAQLAVQIPQMERVVRLQNSNAMQLADYLEKHPGVRHLRWALSCSSAPYFRQVARSTDSCGCILTVELTGSLEPFYDRTPVVKGPSFGTDFTLMCPFMYLAHYDLVSTQAGRSFLHEQGINPDLVRISVGTEPFADIRAAFDLGLS